MSILFKQLYNTMKKSSYKKSENTKSIIDEDEDINEICVAIELESVGLMVYY